MNPGVLRALGWSFIAVTILFFVVYGPLARRAAHADAVLLALNAQLNDQEQILKLEPQIRATQVALAQRRAELVAHCMPRCTAVQTKTAEIAALRAIAKSSGLSLISRDFNNVGGIHATSVGSLGASLRALDAYSRLPMPVQMKSVTLTAQGSKVKMDVNGQTIQGGT